MATPPASIVIPTRGRLRYLEVALSSIAPQAEAAGAELLVIDDAGASSAARELVARFGRRVLEQIPITFMSDAPCTVHDQPGTGR